MLSANRNKQGDLLMMIAKRSQLLGVAAAIGGLLMLALFWRSSQNDYDVSLATLRWLTLAALLLAAGVMGLNERAAPQRFGRIGLAVAALSALTMALGFGLMVLAWPDGEIGWPIWVLGMLGHLLGLLIFAVATVRSDGWTRWNIIPLAMGITAMVSIVGLIWQDVIQRLDWTQQSDLPFTAIIGGLTVGWMVLGTLLARPAQLTPALTTILLLLLAGCGGRSAESTPRVFFITPSDNAAVTSPVQIEMGAEQFTIEPAGDGSIHADAGHMHIMIDVPCVAAGQTITKDDNHKHFGDGSTAVALELSPGTHTLCLQAADGAHTALAGLNESITVTVRQ
jgi:hypothetical protein